MVAPDADAPDAPQAEPGTAIVLADPATRSVPKAGQRARDPIWDALAGVFGEPLLESEHGARNAACKQFRDAARKQGLTGAQMAALIVQAHDNWPNVMGGVTETPSGLTKHFTTLLAGPQVNGRSSGVVRQQVQRITQTASLPQRRSVADIRRAVHAGH